MPDPTLRDRFLRVGASNVADALDQLSAPHQALAPHFRQLSGAGIAGPAYTITGAMAPYADSGDPAKMEACNGVGPGQVTVWSGDGEGICYFGELIALGMQERGCAGAVVHGGVRDLAWLEQHGFPVFATYRTPVQSIGRWRVTAWATPVRLPGATSADVEVRPGDYVVGDADGVVIVPAGLVEAALAIAEQQTDTEVRIREALATGRTLAECLSEFGHV